MRSATRRTWNRLSACAKGGCLQLEPHAYARHEIVEPTLGFFPSHRAKFWTGFGQSETTGFVSIQRVLDRPGASGQPVPIAQVKLVDDYDRDVPVGTPGEIAVRGPLVFQGYFGQPDVTAYTLRNGWHHTGDVGRFDADGYLHYVKRKPEKELINGVPSATLYLWTIPAKVSGPQVRGHDAQ